MTARHSLMAAFLCLLACCYAFSQSVDDGPLTNASIVKLVKAGFKEKTIITIIASRPNKFDLSTDQMIDLKRLGVTEKIILEMLAHQQGIVFDSTKWEDDIFFKQGINTKLEKVATLTNESVVELVDAGFSEGTIIRRIEQSPVDFDLTSPKLIELRKHRVTEKIITAMKIAAGEPTE